MLKRLTLSKKLLLLGGIPMVVAIIFILLVIVQTTEKMTNAQSISQLMSLAVSNSNLVHEIQKERGLTASYIADGRSSALKTSLEQQRKEVQSRLETLGNEHEVDVMKGSELAILMSSIEADLKQLSSMRLRIDRGDVSSAQALAYFTNLNEKLLSVVFMVAKTSHIA